MSRLKELVMISSSLLKLHNFKTRTFFLDEKSKFDSEVGYFRRMGEDIIAIVSTAIQLIMEKMMGVAPHLPIAQPLRKWSFDC